MRDAIAVIVGDRTSASQLECTTADQLGNDSQTSCPDPRGSTSALSLPAVPVTVVPWTMPVSSFF